MLKQQVSWKKENKQLDEDAQHNVQLKKQINKQTDMDSIIQNSINDKIYELKVEATHLTKKLQNEKYKNLELQTIIKTVKYRMDDDRKIEANSVTDINFQNIETLERKIKKFEYDLEQIHTRSNRIGAVVSDKKHKISLLRNQRVIDTKIFRNIEKELINSEMEFKKLLIEKIRQEKTYEQGLNEYNSLKAKAQQYFQNKQSSQKSQSVLNFNLDQESQLMQNGKDLNGLNKFRQLQQMSSQYRNTVIQSQFSKEQQTLLQEFKVRKLLMNLNVTNGKEFVYLYHNIQSINDRYFSTLNQTGDLITQLEEQIKKIHKTVEQNAIQFYKPKPNLSKSQQEFLNCQKLKRQVENNHFQAVEEVKNLNQFMDTQNFKQFTQILQLSDDLNENMDMQSLMQFLKSLESKMNQLNYHQAPRLTEEAILLKTGRSEKQRKQQKLIDVMNRIKIYEESDKIMKREQFKEEYRKMIQAGPTTGSRPNINKKTKKIIN